MNRYKVSVILPVYNGERYLKEAIDSILGQTFLDFEFLIINDGSTDRSQEIINNYSDPRIRLLNQENMGLPLSLNRGIDLSLGEYIVRMDADDISMPNRLKQQIDFMDSHKDISICGTNIELINEVGKVIGHMTYPIENEVIKAQLLFSSPLAHPSVIFRKSVFQSDNFKYHNVKSEDFDLWTRLSDFFKFVNIDKYLLKYRFCVGISGNIYKNDYITGAHEIIKKKLIELGNFSEAELSIHEAIYDIKYIPDKKSFRKIILLLRKIRNENLSKKLYKVEALDLAIISKFLSVCGRIDKKNLFFILDFWIYSLLFFCRINCNHKFYLIKKIIIKHNI